MLKQYKYEIKYRVKSKENIERKCKLKNYKDISNVEDIIGIRLLFLNDTYCKEVYHILYNYYKPYKISDYFSNPKETGFKAYLLKINNYKINVEIQIMTIGMNELAEATHYEHEKRKYNS